MDWKALLIPLARKAGNAILDIYTKPYAVQQKNDQSPLTDADLAANTVITRTLHEHTPDIPLLSEEAKQTPYAERKHWNTFWLIDPLDGTKEFIKRNGEFTVNIALIKNGKPVIGVIHAPVLNITYYAENNTAYRITNDTEERIRVSDAHTPLRVIASKSHLNEQTKQYLGTLPQHVLTSRGSSLKFCTIAEGNADLYPRLAPTMEWDTAAAQAILESAGGHVLTTDGKPLAYNKEDLLNPSFIAIGDPKLKPQVKP